MKKLCLIAIAILSVPGYLFAAEDNSNGCYHRFEEFESSVGYCSAVRSGNTLYISGVAAPGEMTAAMNEVYSGLQSVLEAHGLTFANVVKENVFAVDLQAFIDHSDIRKNYYGETFPAATWVGVNRLFTPELVLEVEIIATFD